MRRAPGWQSFAFERATAKITPSLAVNCGPAVTNKVGGDGGRSQTRGVVMGARSRVAGSLMGSGQVSPHLCEDGACRRLSSPAGTRAGSSMEPRLTPHRDLAV